MAQFTGAATGEGTARDDRRGNMSAADKRKLDGLAAIASVAAPLTLASGVLDIQAATAALEGSLSAADKAKLDGIAAGAEVNVLNTVNVSGNAGLSITDTRGTNKTMTVGLADGAWTALPFAANWSNFGGGEAPCQYRKLANGTVEIMGLAKKGIALVANDVIGTLPASGSLRPATNHHLPGDSFAGHASLTVNTAGQVYVQGGGSATWTSLDGVRFDPAT